jgi:hypothetical protein
VAAKPPAHSRIDDGSAVALADAVQEWAREAGPILEDIARRRVTISYGALAEAVQAAAGIRTRMLFRWWIGDVLTVVGDQCEREGGPQLASLCVRADGSIGAGYGEGERSVDLDLRAARDREECYRRYGHQTAAD